MLAFQRLLNVLAPSLRLPLVAEDGKLGDQTLFSCYQIAHFLGIADGPTGPSSIAPELVATLFDLSGRSAQQLEQAEMRQLVVGRPLQPRHYILGTQILKLIGDWDSWVHRRVESWRFGEDDTMYVRTRLLDFTLESGLPFSEPPRPLEFPVPFTFLEKGRLPRLQVQDESGRHLPLLTRHDLGPIGAGTLVALAYRIVDGKPPPLNTRLIPPTVERDLRAIVCERREKALMVCDRLGSARAGSVASHVKPDAEEQEWRTTLATSDAFMEMAFEFALNFLALVSLQCEPVQRRVITMSYEVHGHRPTARSARRDSLRAAKSSFMRPSEDWPVSEGEARPAQYGQLTIRLSCEEISPALSHDPEPLVCIDITLRSPGGRSLTIPLSTKQTSYSLFNLPPGQYLLRPSSREGFQLLTPAEAIINVEGCCSALVDIRTRQLRPSRSRRPRASATLPRATRSRHLARGLGWRSKPHLVRMRLGEGGSVHVNFTVPAGLQITRAKLADDRYGSLDIVLRSVQTAHLHTQPRHSAPSTGYALLNLRPRTETVVRAASLTALFATILLAAIALRWELVGTAGPASVALLLAVPGGLAAYVAQAIPERVTQLHVFGLRGVGLLPGILAFIGAALIVLGNPEQWALVSLWAVVGACATVTLSLLIAVWTILRPPEQRETVADQSPGFADRYLGGRT